MADDDDEETKRVVAWLASQSMENVKRYCAAGRSLSALSTKAVNDRWIAGMNEWSSNLDSPRPAIVDDGVAELTIRGIEAPYDDVRPALAALKKAAKINADRLSADPEAAEAFGKDILDAMDALDAESKRSRN
jgi:hypothetical protein